MSNGQHADDLAAKAAETVRRVVAEAEDRGTEIVRDAEAKAASIHEQAEADAARIRERAEADARGQIEAAKRALDELGGTLVAAATEAIPSAETAEPEPAPEPEPEPEPETESPGAPETPVSPPAENGTDAAERLVAMKLAVDGKNRAAIEAELSERFGASDRAALLDDVLSRAAR
jgi:cell division septum initiation protein DivIVA